MTAIPEDITQDEELSETGGQRTEDRGQSASSGGSELSRPAYSFKGAELFPFTYGYELLFNQVRDREDTGLFTWLAFVFLLRKRRADEMPQEHRKWAISLAWQVEIFREALVAWMDLNGPFTNADKLEAKRIYEESMKAALATAVEVVPGRGARGSQKKTHPRKKP